MSSLFYTVKEGDSLGLIAARNGTTVAKLQKINGINNPDQIDVGQRIALKPEAVCKVEVLLLDLFRNPIKKAKMRLDYCGKSEHFTTGDDGKLPSILTDSPEDTVNIFIAKPDDSWKQITEITSDWGNKLVTLVSPKLKILTKTMPHPKDANGEFVSDPGRAGKKPANPPENPKATQAKGELQSGYGDGKGVKTEVAQNEHGLPTTKVTNDQAELDFLTGYTGEKITEADYEQAARELGCEVEVIKAIGEQESGRLKDIGIGSFDKNNRPTILYERHIFSNKTNHKYDVANPYISSRTLYQAGTPKRDGKSFDDGQHYGPYSWQYSKLAKAYALDKEAALQACSWGKFQVMGGNFKACGFNSAADFAKAMSKSELEHLKALVAYCKANNLMTPLRDKNWNAIAAGYNGPRYNIEYPRNIKKFYEKFKMEINKK